MTELIATTVPGLEDLVAEELASGFGIAARGGRDGAVWLSVEGEPRSQGCLRTIAVLNRWARGSQRIGVALAAVDLPDRPSRALDACYQVARGVDYREMIGRRQSFAVRAVRHGRHGFGSPDIGRVVGQAVIDSYRDAAGVRLAVDLDEPAVILRAEAIGPRFRLWLDTTGDVGLHRRAYRVHHHPASLHPCLAHLMLRAAGWRCQPLLDPMCGVGTIPIEAATWARGLAPSRGREVGFAWERLQGIDAPQAREAAAETLPATLPYCEHAEIFGVERFSRHVQGALLNAAAAGVAADLRIVEGDATALPDVVEPGVYRLVITNPPFGRRIGSRRRAIRLYADFCRSAVIAGVERIVTLAELADPLQEALAAAGYATVERRPVRYGGLDVELFVAALP